MRLSVISSSLAFTLLAACGGPGGSTNAITTPRSSVSTSSVSTGDDDASCPVTIAGTSVSVEDTDTGAALVFVTTGDDGELRKRVAAIAETHNAQHGAMGPLPTGEETASGHDHHDHHDHHGHHRHHRHHGRHRRHAGGMIGVHSAASVEEIRDGARLVFVVAPSDVGKLQSELRQHARHLSGGTCEMAH